jgi:hypothetical protein
MLRGEVKTRLRQTFLRIPGVMSAILFACGGERIAG